MNLHIKYLLLIYLFVTTSVLYLMTTVVEHLLEPATPAAPARPVKSSSPRGHILVTGGVGYIGSHTTIQLLKAGYDITIVDNLWNSNPAALERIAILADGLKPNFYQVDVRDAAALEKVFQAHHFDACIHFAGLKAVGESMQKPLDYYDHNVGGSMVLFRLLMKYNCKKVVFSSSATVYGLAEHNPIPETAPLSTTNTYGQTKLVIEGMLRDLGRAPVPEGEQPWKIVILRYFNPVGAHPSGLIGEDPNGIPNNLCPFIMQVAIGRRPEVNVFGNDYDTPDGTGVRDYIHVEDLAAGHLAAIEHGIFGDALGGQSCDVFNLGSGKGVSVLEMIKAAEIASGRQIPYKIAPRRAGDIATCYADARKANEKLHWKTTKTLQDSLNDSWKWQSQNPEGFAKK